MGSPQFQSISNGDKMVDYNKADIRTTFKALVLASLWFLYISIVLCMYTVQYSRYSLLNIGFISLRFICAKQVFPSQTITGNMKLLNMDVG